VAGEEDLKRYLRRAKSEKKIPSEVDEEVAKYNYLDEIKILEEMYSE
jgi:SOS response regulatory protein OraA/RecX